MTAAELGPGGTLHLERWPTELPLRALADHPTHGRHDEPVREVAMHPFPPPSVVPIPRRITAPAWRAVTTGLACGLAAAACSGESTAPGLPVARVTVVPAAAVLVPDSTVQLAAVVEDSLGHVLAGRGVTWASQDTTVVRVSPSGLARAATLPAWMEWSGATVRATAEGRTGTTYVTVVRRIDHLAVIPDSLTLFTGESSNLRVAVVNPGGAPAYVAAPVWSTSDTTRVPVDAFGVVRALRPGDATISVRAAGLDATGVVHVLGRAATVTIQPPEPTVVIGQAVQLTATVRDSAGNVLTGRTVTWSEPGRAIASLTEGGLLTAFAAGTTPIIATVEGRADTVTFTASTDGPFVDVASGEVHTCATTSAGTTYCWGNGWYGQLGTGGGDVGGFQSAVRVTGSGGFRSLVARGNHNCALDASGAASCWGLDAFGGLGNSAGVAPCAYGEPCRGSPSPVADTARFVSLSPGRFHTCGVTTSGLGECWGANVLGQLGIGGEDGLSHPPTPILAGVAFASLSAGGEFTCGLTAAGEAYCWGPFLPGETVDTATADSLRRVVGAPVFSQLSAGYYHVCGLTSAGVVWCWGYGYSGTPTSVPSGATFTHIYAGYNYTCALDAVGQAFCWGDNSWGQLGDGTTQASETPVAVAGGLRYTALSAGGYHVCGLATSGRLYCWGDDINGEIGDGRWNQLALVPTLVLGQP